MHDLAIITMLAAALAAALALGWLTQRIGLSPLVGYLLAGIAVGPNTPGFVADTTLAAQLAEIGVILLMFGVGLHFHPGELLRVWRVAVPGAVLQSAVAAGIGWAVAMAFGWTHISGLVLGMALAVASTVVLMRMLMERGRLDSPDGHIAIGWLIVEDLFTIVALVVLPVLAVDEASGDRLGLAVLWALAKVSVFALLAWTLGPRLVTPLLDAMARTRSQELFTLAVFVLALGIAAGAPAVFEVSVALGAFFGGLVVAQSRVGHQAAADMMSFRDVFSALFFVSVGMLFDPRFVIENPGITLAALGVILIAKPLVALAFVLLLGHPARNALTVAIGLAQIGEFSFILAGLGKSMGVLPQAGFDVLVAGAMFSIAVNPLLFKAQPALERWMDSLRATDAAILTPVRGQDADADVIVAGYGEIGQALCERLTAGAVRFCVIDNDLERCEAAERAGLRYVFGHAGATEPLGAAGVARARVLVLAFPSLPDRMQATMAARRMHPDVTVVAYAKSDGERAWLQEFGVQWVLHAPREVASALYVRLEDALGVRKQDGTGN